MRGIEPKEELKSLRLLRKRLKEMLETPMFVGKQNIETILIDDFVVSLALGYCDIDYVLKRIKELRYGSEQTA